METYKSLTLLISVLVLLAVIGYVYATPEGPTIVTKGNSTKSPVAATKVNESGNDTNAPYKAGGFIFTITLNSEQQNSRWKAYVGNVTGTLVLDDADGYTIYEWSIDTSLTGEVYATRASGSVNWTNINCSYANSTYWENVALNHTNVNDNISATFNDTDNSEFYVGNQIIHANTCPTINTNVNDSTDWTDDFEEVLLYDGQRRADPENGGINLTDNTNFQNVVYAVIVEEDAYGYNNNGTNGTQSKYDFQTLLPEVGYSGWTSSTAYYFYVELT